MRLAAIAAATLVLAAARPKVEWTGRHVPEACPKLPAACRSNLKQIGIATFTYISETNGWMMSEVAPWAVTADDINGTGWHTSLMSHMSGAAHRWPTKSHLHNWANEWGSYGAGVDAALDWQDFASVMFCPQDPMFGNASIRPASWHGAYALEARASSYGAPQHTWQYYRTRFTSDYSGVNLNIWMYSESQIQDVKRASESVMFFQQAYHFGTSVDGTWQTINAYHGINTGSWVSETLYHHPGPAAPADTDGEWFGSCNYLYFDGHVAALPKAPYNFGAGGYKLFIE